MFFVVFFLFFANKSLVVFKCFVMCLVSRPFQQCDPSTENLGMQAYFFRDPKVKPRLEKSKKREGERQKGREGERKKGRDVLGFSCEVLGFSSEVLGFCPMSLDLSS